MRKKKKTLDNYIDIAKTDIYVYLVVTIIFFSYLCYGVYIYKNFFLFFFGFIIIIPFSPREKVKVYKDLKKIKKYLLNNDLLTKIGEIDFWNEESYFLTENYMIVINNGVINHFAYSDIKQMYKKTYHDIAGTSHYIQKYLHIILKDDREYKVLIYSTMLVNENFRDISGYLLSKNKDIIID